MHQPVIVDKQSTHYKYIGKNGIDDSIYVQYISEDVTEVATDIVAERAGAKIYLNEDEMKRIDYF